jgi:transcription elongation GreA/GreB family factor
MNDQISLKRKLFSFCEDYVNQKIESAQEAIDNAQDSANEETKSSSGDKYETGRSMMQLEIEKYASQLEEGLKLKKALNQINIEKQSKFVIPGSLVITNNGNYFISISAGKLVLKSIEYISISISSPLGQSLYNKSENDEIIFRDKVYKIEAIY